MTFNGAVRPGRRKLRGVSCLSVCDLSSSLCTSPAPDTIFYRSMSLIDLSSASAKGTWCCQPRMIVPLPLHHLNRGGLMLKDLGRA